MCFKCIVWKAEPLLEEGKKFFLIHTKLPSTCWVEEREIHFYDFWIVYCDLFFLQLYTLKLNEHNNIVGNWCWWGLVTGLRSVQMKDYIVSINLNPSDF